MESQKQPHVPNSLRDGGVAILGIGVMGAAYAARLSSLGIPTTLYNRTRSKAEHAAAGKKSATVVGSVEEAARASDTILVACSPTLEAIRALCDPLVEKGLVKGKHVVFIVDAGTSAAKYMEAALHEHGNAASVVNVAMFGTCFDAMQGGTFAMNASGLATKEALDGTILPLLKLFGTVTFHEGGPRVASIFAMAMHASFLPFLYGQMHYVALMQKGGVDPATAMQYFKQFNAITLEGFAPMLASLFEKRDYSVFFFSHGLVKGICDELRATCDELGVDGKLAALFAEYHERAMRDPRIAAKAGTSVYDVIDPKRS